MWGIVFAREDVEDVLARAIAEIESPPQDSVLGDRPPVISSKAGCAEVFDNLRYALGRIELFRQEAAQLYEVGIDAI